MSLLQMLAAILAVFWATEMIAVLVIGLRARHRSLSLPDERPTQ